MTTASRNASHTAAASNILPTNLPVDMTNAQSNALLPTDAQVKQSVLPSDSAGHPSNNAALPDLDGTRQSETTVLPVDSGYRNQFWPSES